MASLPKAHVKMLFDISSPWSRIAYTVLFRYRERKRSLNSGVPSNSGYLNVTCDVGVDTRMSGTLISSLFPYVCYGPGALG